MIDNVINPYWTLDELTDHLPKLPHGHVEQRLALDLSNWAARLEHGTPQTTIRVIQELTGLIARAKYLIENPPGPTNNAPAPPTGGTPIAQRIAA